MSGKRKRRDDHSASKKPKLNKEIESISIMYDNHLIDFYSGRSGTTADVKNNLCLLLQKGRELELYQWMLNSNMLKTPSKCANADCGNSLLKLTKNPLFKERYVWECAECSHEMSIKTDTFFNTLKCSIQVALLVIQAWYDKVPPEEFENYFDTKLPEVRKIYQLCFDSINLLMKTPTESQILGGVNSVVILDMWPNGSLPVPPHKRESKQRWGERVRVLWLSDTNHNPVRYWAKVLPPMKTSFELRQQARKIDSNICEGLQHNAHCNGNFGKTFDYEDDIHHQNQENLCGKRPLSRKSHLHSCSENEPPEGQVLQKTCKNSVESPYRRQSKNRAPTPVEFKDKKKKEESDRLREMLKAVIEAAQSHIAPSSLVLANEQALPGICDALESSGRYEGVKSIDQLMAVKSHGPIPTSNILENIWKIATEVCKELQNASRTLAHNKLTEFLWRQRYDTGASKSFHHILNHIAAYYDFQVALNFKPSTDSDH